MFKHIPDPTAVFVWFLCAAGLSFLYDLYARLLMYCADTKARDEKEKDAIGKYRQKTLTWIKADLVLVLAAAAMHYLYPLLGVGSSLSFAALFVASMIFLLLVDVGQISLLTVPER